MESNQDGHQKEKRIIKLKIVYGSTETSSRIITFALYEFQEEK